MQKILLCLIFLLKIDCYSFTCDSLSPQSDLERLVHELNDKIKKDQIDELEKTVDQLIDKNVLLFLADFSHNHAKLLNLMKQYKNLWKEKNEKDADAYSAYDSYAQVMRQGDRAYRFVEKGIKVNLVEDYKNLVSKNDINEELKKIASNMEIIISDIINNSPTYEKISVLIQDEPEKISTLEYKRFLNHGTRDPEINVFYPIADIVKRLIQENDHFVNIISKTIKSVDDILFDIISIQVKAKEGEQSLFIQDYKKIIFKQLDICDIDFNSIRSRLNEIFSEANSDESNSSQKLLNSFYRQLFIPSELIIELLSRLEKDIVQTIIEEYFIEKIMNEDSILNDYSDILKELATLIVSNNIYETISNRKENKKLKNTLEENYHIEKLLLLFSNNDKFIEVKLKNKSSEAINFYTPPYKETSIVYNKPKVDDFIQWIDNIKSDQLDFLYDQKEEIDIIFNELNVLTKRYKEIKNLSKDLKDAGFTELFILAKLKIEAFQIKHKINSYRDLLFNKIEMKMELIFQYVKENNIDWKIKSAFDPDNIDSKYDYKFEYIYHNRFREPYEDDNPIVFECLNISATDYLDQIYESIGIDKKMISVSIEGIASHEKIQDKIKEIEDKANNFFNNNFTSQSA